jgi:type IV pilus assembly protein PilF
MPNNSNKLARINQAMLKKTIISLLIINIAACSIFSRPKNVGSDPPSNSNVQLGLAYLQHGDVERAKEKLLLAEQQEPASTESQGAMGYFLESTGNFVEAEAYYRRAISLNPKSGAAQNNYGAFLCRRGRYKEADQHFLLALQDPTYLKTAQVYENAGLCAMEIPNFTKAASYFSKAITQDPQRPIPWLELGEISYQQKNYPKARHYLERYMQLTSDPTPRALWLAAILARRLGDETAAGRYTLMLQTRFPNSKAYKDLLSMPKTKNKPQKRQLYY